ncbi:MAG: hypothetical protein H7222_09300 [Methylotenera sp.]|nr:hypothetical protein [Oligoflexia bacterium]
MITLACRNLKSVLVASGLTAAFTVLTTGCEPLDYRNSPVQSNTAPAARSVIRTDQSSREITPPIPTLRPPAPNLDPVNYGGKPTQHGKKREMNQQSDRPDWPVKTSHGGHPGGSRPEEDLPGEDFPNEDLRDGDLSLPGIAVAHPCRNADPRNLCLNLKYVTYQDRHASGPDHEQVLKALDQANQIWSSCGIEFQLDDYSVIDPVRYRLRSTTTDYQELSRIRRTFADDRHLLIVATSNWNRSGSLGNTWANAWTNLPGDAEQGAIIERRVAHDPNIIAHELGHYLSLDHVSDSEDLMNPLIYSDSTKLTRSQCASARWAAKAFWAKVLQPDRSGGE